MGHSKAGNNKNGPSHLRYKSENHRRRNKLRRILKCNGEVFASWWEKVHG